MNTDHQVLDHSVPKHDLAALHHDKASRLLVAMGHGHLGAHQAVRLSQTLQVATSQSASQRLALFDGSIERFTRPFPAEKGLQKRLPNSVPTASTSTTHSEKDVGHMHPSLSHALPEWYETQNPHCLACSVPLLIGINSNFDPIRRGLVCAACGSGSPIGMPDTESKRGLRSMRVRKTLKAKDQGSNLAVNGQASKKARIEPESLHKDKMMSSEQKKGRDDDHKPEQMPKTKDTEGNQPKTESLDARMKQKKKDKKGSQTASAIENIEMTQPTPRPDKSQSKYNTAQHASGIPPLPSNVPNIPNDMKTKTKSQQLPLPSKPRDMKAKGNDKQALRNMLAANKKKKDDVSKTSSSNAKSTSSSGLQSFLDSL